MILPFVYILVALVIFFCCYDCVKPSNFPPGPKWYPFVGSFLLFQKLQKQYKYTYIAFEKLSEQYGPILGVKFGKQKVIVISTHDLVKKVLLRDEFNGRPDLFFFRVRSFGKRKGVLFTDGEVWAQHRKFTIRHLKNFGLGQIKMIQYLTIEAENLVDNLKRLAEDGSVPMQKILSIAVLNTLWTMFAGHRFEYNDEKMDKMLQVVHDVFKLSDTMGGILSHMPFLRFVMPKLSGYEELMSNLNKLWGFLNDEINVHEENMNIHEEPRDLIDAFLRQIKNRGGDSENTIFNREDLLVLCLDLFLAGSKTTSDTLTSTFMFLALHPHWYQRLQKELDTVIGRNRPPRIEDSFSLPITEAFLAEVHRYLILAPLGVPHKTTKNVNLDGYEIPKNTTVLVNFHSVYNDHKYWENPEEFQPERFLNSDGQFQNNHAAMPFGLGKRRCLGEMLARPTLFLFLTYVLHYFDLGICEKNGPPDPDPLDGFTVSPKPYYLRLALRS